jgi:hypothetical protein
MHKGSIILKLILKKYCENVEWIFPVRHGVHGRSVHKSCLLFIVIKLLLRKRRKISRPAEWRSDFQETLCSYKTIS